MTPVTPSPPRPAALFVRRRDDLEASLAMVEALLAERRRLEGERAEVVAIFVHPRLDELLIEHFLQLTPGVAPVESVGVSGVWSLCWLAPSHPAHPRHEDVAR